MTTKTTRRGQRQDDDHEETTSLSSDAVLDLVRVAFASKNPTKQVRRVRWSLDGVAIDAVDRGAAAMAG